VGHDAGAWLTHALRGAQQLFRSTVVLGGITDATGFSLHSRLRLFLSLGWEGPPQEKAALDFMAREGPGRDPSFQPFQAGARPNITLRPLRLLPRRAFEASEFRAALRGFGIEDMLFSQRETSSRSATFSLSPQRPPRDARFTARDLRLLRLLHDELARL